MMLRRINFDDKTVRRIFLPALLLLLVIASVPTTAQTKWFTAYYATWMQANLGQNGYAQPPWEVDWTGVTHIVHFDNANVQTVAPYFSYVVNNQTGIEDSIDLFWSGIAYPYCGPPCWTTNYVDSLIAVAHRNNAKVLITIAAVDAANLNYVAVDSGRTDVFANAVVSFAKRHGYDGVELDWEGWLTPITSPANVNRLIRRLRHFLNTMNPRGLLFLSPSSDHKDLYWPSQDTLIDMYNLQMYDYAIVWHGGINAAASWFLAPLHTGTIPPLFEGESYSSRGPLQWAAAGHDISRVGALLPTLGIVFKGVDQLFQDYRDNVAVDLNAQDVSALTSVGGTYHWDSVRKVPYVAGTATRAVPWPIDLIRGQKFFGTFENIRSIQEKVAWLKAQGAGGIGLYDLKGDSDPSKPFGQRNPLHKAAVQSLAVSVDRKGDPKTPDGFGLMENFPNPFNPGTEIRYRLTKTNFVELILYDITGRQIAILERGHRGPGTHSVRYQANNVPSGVYVVVLRAGDREDSTKIVLIK